ncbi:MAG: GIY-YIG nuclease family protein [Bacilli bacterium]
MNQRITEAKKDPTYLLADVELVATYSLPENIVPQKLEKLIHKALNSAQIYLVIEDRFGNPVKPKEWFLVSLNIINDIIDHIKNGSIETVYYDAEKAQLISTS